MLLPGLLVLFRSLLFYVSFILLRTESRLLCISVLCIVLFYMTIVLCVFISLRKGK